MSERGRCVSQGHVHVPTGAGECASLLAAWLLEAQRQRWRPRRAGPLAVDGGLAASPADEEALDFSLRFAALH